MFRFEIWFMKLKLNKIRLGKWFFLIGFTTAILITIFPYLPSNVSITILFLLGLSIGIFNITVKEFQSFLLASLILLVISPIRFTELPMIGLYFNAVLINITILVSSAALLVALKTIYNLTKNK